MNIEYFIYVLYSSYVVFGDGKRIMEVDDGTADNAVIDVKDSSFSSVTVRTKSNDKLSAESSSCPVPPACWKTKIKNKTDQMRIPTLTRS